MGILTPDELSDYISDLDNASDDEIRPEIRELLRDTYNFFSEYVCITEDAQDRVDDEASELLDRIIEVIGDD